MKPNSKEAKVLEAYNEGLTNPYEIAFVAGCSVLTVGEYLRKNNIYRGHPKKNYTKRKKQERNKKAKSIISELLECKKSGSQIAREYGVSKQYVSELKIKELGARL